MHTLLTTHVANAAQNANAAHVCAFAIWNMLGAPQGQNVEAAAHASEEVVDEAAPQVEALGREPLLEQRA
eukprot:12968692-Alexandrium_andersonii.AAC.1